MSDFASILDRPSSEIEKPKPLPVGSYVCTVRGLPKHDKSTKKQTPYVEFTLQPTAALDDVDQDDLQAMGGFANKTIRATYYLTEDAAWRLNEFIEHCGIEAGDRSLRECIDETPNCQVIANIKHEASQDGTSVFAKLASTAAVK